MFRLNSEARSAIRCLRTNRQMAIALSRSSMPAMASARSSRSSCTHTSADDKSTRSPGRRVSLRMFFSMALSMALAKYRLG